MNVKPKAEVDRGKQSCIYREIELLNEPKKALPGT
jgi:hypothetical protein